MRINIKTITSSNKEAFRFLFNEDEDDIVEMDEDDIVGMDEDEDEE